MRIYLLFVYFSSIIVLRILLSHPHSINANFSGCCIYSTTFKSNTCINVEWAGKQTHTQNTALVAMLRCENPIKTKPCIFVIQFDEHFLLTIFICTSKATQGHINKIFVVYSFPRIWCLVWIAQKFMQKNECRIRWCCQHNNITNSNSNSEI